MADEFEWDTEKAKANYKKHKVRFEEAARIFDGDCLTRIDDEEDYGELREITIGALSEMVVLTVVHTDRDGVIRIISARKADGRERRDYDEHCAKKP